MSGKDSRSALSTVLAGAYADLARLEALLPALLEHAGRRPGTFGHAVEDDDAEALADAEQWLDDLHVATEALVGVLARGPGVAGAMAARPLVPATTPRTLCDRCGRPQRSGERFRQRLCVPCYGRMARWRAAKGNAGKGVSEWMAYDGGGSGARR
ncbi:hypothetical protein GHK86_02595 [Acidimicrobiaceae bacterium USS-CC1]|uniref:Uncharacterized protein n=1 Tax=Acidiferrimicrobium australe TaxID=2664430 RepID=A0ABW9QPN7_9ACTN|nr:hypothetical protein [Acidiferrimicrobium australe]